MTRTSERLVFLLGAQKAATTTLAHLLNQHPEVCLSEPKEPNFFTNSFGEGTNWYQACFDTNNETSVCLDASTSNSMIDLHRRPDSPNNLAPKRIKDFCPDAKFIYVLRDPVERTYSAYWHEVKVGREIRPFLEALKENSEYQATSCYHLQLTSYLQYFAPEQFLLVNFEDIKRNSQAIVTQCLAFLDLTDTIIDPISSAHKNPSFQYSVLGKIVRDQVGDRRRLVHLTSLLRRFLPQTLWNLLRRLASRPIPKILKEDQLFLAKYFEDDQSQLSKLVESENFKIAHLQHEARS